MAKWVWTTEEHFVGLSCSKMQIIPKKKASYEQYLSLAVLAVRVCIGRIAEIYDRENGSVHTKESMLCIAIFMRKMTVCQNVSFTKNAYFTR